MIKTVNKSIPKVNQYKYLIIGGGVAGTTAAETIRRIDPTGSIGIISDEPYPLYSKVMLSKPAYFLGKMPEEQVFLRKPEQYKSQKIDLILGKKAVRLDAGKKIIGLDGGGMNGYEKLLLAVGGCPRKWPVKGAEKTGVFYLRTLDDYKQIKSALKPGSRVVVIGSGFISFEMCDILRQAGYEVTIVMLEPYFNGFVLDEVSGKIIDNAIAKGGVRIYHNAEVAEVLGEKQVGGVVLKDGTKIDCEAIICGIGLVCPLEWIKEAGVEVSRGIIANEHLETNLPDIWAAGDAAEYNDLILGERIQTGTWLSAQMQGRLAGLNMAGKKGVFRLVVPYTAEGFGINLAFVGDTRPLPDRKFIPRGSLKEGSYSRLIIRYNEIIGATLVNRTAELSTTAKLIEQDTKINGLEDKLSDPNFDLKTLIK